MKKRRIALFMVWMIVAMAGCQGAQGEKAEQASGEETETRSTEEAGGKGSGSENGTGSAEEADGEETGDGTGSAGESSTGVSMTGEREEPEWEEKAKIVLGDSVSVDGTGAQAEEGILAISEGGSYEITGTWSQGMIYVNTKEAVRLKLNGVSITNAQGPAIYVDDAKEVWIETVEGTENVCVDGATYDSSLAANASGELAKGTIFSNL